VLLRDGAVLGGDEVPDPQPQRLLARVPGDALAGAVHPREPPLQIVRVDDVAGVLDQVPVGRLFHRPMVSAAVRAGKQTMVHTAEREQPVAVAMLQEWLSCSLLSLSALFLVVDPRVAVT